MYRIAIIGSGPSGLFVMDQLFRDSREFTIHMFDKLPTPYGLLRTGVAPDHQSIKQLQLYFEKIISKHRDHFEFFGNVHFGQDIFIDDIRDYYHAIFVCTGSENDRPLSLKGMSLDNVIPSRKMVRWYNSHPLYPRLDLCLKGQTAALIGIGNVSIDIARMLLKDQAILSKTDISDVALNELKHSRIKTIHMFARRSPVQSAFTSKEFKELIQLPDLNVIIDTNQHDLSTQDMDELNHSSKAKSNMALISNIKPNPNASRQLFIHYYSQPSCILGTDIVSGIQLERTTLSGLAGQRYAKGTGTIYTVDCDYVFLSIGYVGVPIKGLPFDEKRFIIPNAKGRIEKGLYTAGWIKRGAQGVVGTNRNDAKETLASFFTDIETLTSPKQHKAIEDLLKEKSIVWINYNQWLKINKYELDQGLKTNKIRSKFEQTQSILNFLKKRV